MTILISSSPPVCEECGRSGWTNFFWHGYRIGRGLATCLACKVLNYFPAADARLSDPGRGHACGDLCSDPCRYMG